MNDENNVADCSTQTGEYVDLDGASGKFKISGLVWGEYQLIESKAPDGYDLDTTPHTFRIGPLEGDNIAGNWYANTGFNNADTSAYNEQTTFTVNGGNIKNQCDSAGDWWRWRLLDLRGGFGGCVDRCCCGWNGPQGQEAAMMNSSRGRGGWTVA